MSLIIVKLKLCKISTFKNSLIHRIFFPQTRTIIFENKRKLFSNFYYTLRWDKNTFTIHVLLMCVGNDNLHLMTADTRQRLRVDLADWEGNTKYAEYDNFTVGSAQEKYKLASLGTYHGTARQYDVKHLVHHSLL